MRFHFTEEFCFVPSGDFIFFSLSLNELKKKKKSWTFIMYIRELNALKLEWILSLNSLAFTSCLTSTTYRIKLLNFPWKHQLAIKHVEGRIPVMLWWVDLSQLPAPTLSCSLIPPSSTGHEEKIGWKSSLVNIETLSNYHHRQNPNSLIHC